MFRVGFSRKSSSSYHDATCCYGYRTFNSRRPRIIGSSDSKPPLSLNKPMRQLRRSSPQRQRFEQLFHSRNLSARPRLDILGPSKRTSILIPLTPDPSFKCINSSRTITFQHPRFPRLRTVPRKLNDKLIVPSTTEKRQDINTIFCDTIPRLNPPNRFALRKQVQLRTRARPGDTLDWRTNLEIRDGFIEFDTAVSCVFALN